MEIVRKEVRKESIDIVGLTPEQFALIVGLARMADELGGEEKANILSEASIPVTKERDVDEQFMVVTDELYFALTER